MKDQASARPMRERLLSLSSSALADALGRRGAVNSAPTAAEVETLRRISDGGSLFDHR